MVRKIHVKYINQYIWRSGPYIVFFNGLYEGYNKELVINMLNMANTYPLLEVFEIEWSNKKMFDPSTSNEVLDTIYMYSHGTIIKEVFKPNQNQINEFFKKAIAVYNKNLERLAMKIGSKQNRCYPYMNSSSNIPLTKSQKMLIDRRRKYVLKNKLEFKKPELSNESNNLINSKTDYKNTKICKSYFSIDKSYEGKKINKINHIQSESNKWFLDIKTNDLPIDIFQDEPIFDSQQKFKNEYKDKKISEEFLKVRSETQNNIEHMNKRISINICLANKRLLPGVFDISPNETQNIYKSPGSTL